MNPKFVAAFVATFIALAAGLSVLFLQQCGGPDAPPADVQAPTGPASNPDATELPKTEVPDDIASADLPEDKAPEPQPPVKYATPEQLLDAIGQAIESNDIPALELVLPDQLSEPQRAAISALAGKAKLRQPSHIREIGELRRGEAGRYALEFADGTGIVFDVETASGERDWKVADARVDKGTAGSRVGSHADSLGISTSFIVSALSLEFEAAREFVDRSTVSDAKIAGLCILFEESGYRLRKKKPLRAMLQREDSAAYLVNLTAPDGSDATAQFGITTRKAPDDRWLITDIALDKLLSDYAARFADGDIHYSPIITNPSGGDTIVIYFDFDDNGLTERTSRQLAIVAGLLKTDPAKRISLTGHTDALGSEDYNRTLSADRAATVRDYLVSQGVNDAQVRIVAAGESNPRRPETNDAGEDDPSGRRANRRTEVYLDF